MTKHSDKICIINLTATGPAGSGKSYATQIMVEGLLNDVRLQVLEIESATDEGLETAAARLLGLVAENRKLPVLVINNGH